MKREKFHNKSVPKLHNYGKLVGISPNTLAQFNKVSIKVHQHNYQMNRPNRIYIPQFFNIPSFKDKDLQLDLSSKKQEQSSSFKAQERILMDVSVKKRLKDFTILAEGMKRAKNIKQQSRYYFIQGIIMHNCGIYKKAIQFFEKFLKIVLFIKDEKSVELALNSIGICFMYLRDPEKSIEYHRKQYSITENSDYFIGKINVGLCYEMMNQYNDAHRQYQQAQEDQKKKSQPNNKKIAYSQKLIECIQKKMLQTDMFITEKTHLNYSRNSSMQKSTDKIKYKMKMDKSIHDIRNYEKAKVGYAVSSAQQGMEIYMNTLKRDFSQQKCKTDQSFQQHKDI